MRVAMALRISAAATTTKRAESASLRGLYPRRIMLQRSFPEGELLRV